MLGNFAVGKSSLVRRYVTGVFDERYQTTVGVKIDTVQAELAQAHVKMLLWDLAGAAELDANSRAYIRGMQAYLLVADGTRMDTVLDAERIQAQVLREVGPLPFILLLNKHDLTNWAVPEAWIENRRAQGWRVMPCSALSGEAVSQAFLDLAQASLSPRDLEMRQ